MKIKSSQYEHDMPVLMDGTGFIDVEQIENKGIKAWVRLETSDPFVLKEVSRGDYRKLDITPDDVILDFGLNIGLFTVYALQRGAKEVHSFEPEVQNFELAVLNTQLNEVSDRCTLNNAAVVGNYDTERNFSINVKKNKGAHSLVAKRGRDTVAVKCENINDIIERVNPTIIKMDIEGGEFEVLTAIKDENWNGIQQIIFEYHHAHLNDIKTREKYNVIIDLMKKNFPNVKYSKEPKGAWVTMVYAWR